MVLGRRKGDGGIPSSWQPIWRNTATVVRAAAACACGYSATPSGKWKTWDIFKTKDTQINQINKQVNKQTD